MSLFLHIQCQKWPKSVVIVDLVSFFQFCSKSFGICPNALLGFLVPAHILYCPNFIINIVAGSKYGLVLQKLHFTSFWEFSAEFAKLSSRKFYGHHQCRIPFKISAQSAFVSLSYAQNMISVPFFFNYFVHRFNILGSCTYLAGDVVSTCSLGVLSWTCHVNF